MTSVAATRVIKYNPDDTISLPLSNASSGYYVTPGTPIYIDTSGYFLKADASAVSKAATHIAVNKAYAAPSNQDGEWGPNVTAVRYGVVELASALSNIGGMVYLADTAGTYSDTVGTNTQYLGYLLKGGKKVHVDIQQINNNYK